MSRQIIMALMPFGIIACSAPPLSVQQMSAISRFVWVGRFLVKRGAYQML